MIGLDTNVLVRFLVEDDPEQSRLAGDLIDAASARGRSMFIADIVMCETVWVLSAAYGFRRVEIADVLDRLLRARSMVFESSDRLASALGSYRKGQGDFADYLIQRQAHAHGAEALVTFDKALLKHAGFADANLGSTILDHLDD